MIAGTHRSSRLVLRSAVLTVALVSSLGAQGETTLGVAGRRNANVRAASSGAMVVLAWTGATKAGQDIYTATSRDGGVTFAAPVRVNARAFDARTEGEQPPVVSLAPRVNADPDVVVTWLAKRGEAWRLLQARSTNGGSSYGATIVVPGTDADGARGWMSATAGRAGVLTMWVDHRNHELLTKHAHAANSAAAPTPDAEQFAGMSQLYTVLSDGRNAARPIASSICYCCKTSLTTAPDGTIHAVWRHVFRGDQRDIALASSQDGGRTFSAPVRVHEDRWTYDGCPDDGPTVAVDATRRTHVVWPSPMNVTDPNTMRLWHASTVDGRTFSSRVQVPTTGQAGHVTLAPLADGAVLLVWDEPVAGGRQVRAVRIAADAAGRATFTPATAASAGRYPTVTGTPGGALMAWTRPITGGSLIAVRRIAR